MSDLARMETDLEIARSDLGRIARMITDAGIPESSPNGTPLHLVYRLQLLIEGHASKARETSV